MSASLQVDASHLSTAPSCIGALKCALTVDPVLFYVCFWADKTGVPLPPRLAKHYRLMLARPAVDRVLREEGYNPAKLNQPPAG